VVVARSNERANERLARHIVSTVLGVPVDRFEDGMANRQVDALIRYPDRLAALEIVADHDAAFNAQWDVLNRLGHKLQVPGLRQAWMVQLGRRAKIRDVERELPAMLLAQQDSLPPEGLLWDDESSDLEGLNIRSARRIDDSMASGLAYLYAEGWWGPRARSTSSQSGLHECSANSLMFRRSWQGTPASPSGMRSFGPDSIAVSACTINCTGTKVFQSPRLHPHCRQA
jgi:hypothetical protein